MIKHWSEFLEGQRQRAGAMRQHFPTFVAALAGRGYAKTTVEQQVRVVAELGRWLERRKLLAGELDEQKCSEFLRYRQRQGRLVRAHRTTLRILLDVLRGCQVIGSRDRTAADRDDPISGIQHAFKFCEVEWIGIRNGVLHRWRLLIERQH